MIRPPTPSDNSHAPSTVLEEARALVTAGVSVIPVRTDGSKTPDGRLLPHVDGRASWTPYMGHPPTEEELRCWFGRPDPRGIGVVCGAVSGHLEVLDFDDGSLFVPWRELVEAECPVLVERLTVVQTPREPLGFHVWFRCPELEIPGSEKLARDENNKALIETKGEGGYGVAPGSPPACHETGRSYIHIAGPPIGGAVISAEEREVLRRCARSFDRQLKENHKPKPEAVGNGRRPGEEFDLRGPDWAEILVPHGWQLACERGQERRWRRPGKSGRGWSATTGFCRGKDGADLLRVFSANAAPFEDDRAYGKFAAYALLNHRGDLSAAARELAGKGYGDTQHHTNAGSASDGGAAKLVGEGLSKVVKDGKADLEALFHDTDLLKALARLAEEDPGEFACKRAFLSGAKVRLKDLDAALAPLRRELRRKRPPATTAGDYKLVGGRIVRVRATADGPVEVALCNFSARIAEEVVHDDGAEQMRHLALEGSLADGTPLPRAEVPASEFAAMNWVVPAWGTRAVIHAGMGTKDHLRAALQLLSNDVPRRTIYRHVGWRQVGGDWFYLHAGGGIGADGLVENVPVLLPKPLVDFRLPAPPDGVELQEAIRASLGLLRLGPDRHTIPLLAAPYRAVLGQTDFALHLTGPTGSYKSEAAALVQQHFGAGLDARHLPANWSSTGNALEGLAFAAKDAVLVVDDFCPVGSTADVQRLHREADRLFRAQGNHSGRHRMCVDTSLRPSKPPRGLTLSTGEDTPRGQSLRARLFGLDISPGDFGPQPPSPNPLLTACQRDAAAGKYAASLAGFIRWLAPKYGAVQGRLRAEMEELREQARASGHHARTPGIVAELALGLRYFAEFAEAVGALSASERVELWQRGWVALGEAAAEQVSQLAAAEPVGQFLRLLRAILASGKAHIADPGGREPSPHPNAWGWREKTTGVGQNRRTDWEALGPCVGWIHGDDVLLEPEAVFAEVQKLAVSQGESLVIGSRTLWKRLHEKGVLAGTERRGGKLRMSVRRTIGGERRDLLMLKRQSIYPSEVSRVSQKAQNQQESQQKLRDTTATGSVPAQESVPAAGTLTPNAGTPGPQAEDGCTSSSHDFEKTCGDLGHSGHLETGGEATEDIVPEKRIDTVFD
jgi:hypothetical protein